MSSINENPKKRPKSEKSGANVTDQFDSEDSAQRRVLRSGYLSIHNFIREQKDEIAVASTKKFQSILDEVDGMHHLVKAPREQVSDAVALQELVNTLITSVRTHTTGGITPPRFISSLITKYGQTRRKEINEKAKILWKDLGSHVSPILMICRGSSTMFGPLLRKPKPLSTPISRKPSRKSLKVKLTQPKEIEGRVCKEMTNTDNIVATMFEILKDNTDVCLENITVNRISFAQTVENLFALSFLVKDGRVMITVDEKGSHHVSPKNAPASSMIMSRKVVHTHFVFKFSFKDWKLMKDLVAEGSELMPHRTKETCVNPKSEPNCNANNSRATRTPTKTISRNLDMDFEEEMKPDVIHEPVSNGGRKRKWGI
ncbi:non-structural maintenance of chromosomes element 4 homolog A-like [Rutidosis leptorrhynchoides]|uniref:non-structural maintenance of chromosomes element 4 homolog A-like n=1 Tax=Rutidosis leptorrhynchoides TaxID=125765 RepID=UPI003A993BE9